MSIINRHFINLKKSLTFPDTLLAVALPCEAKPLIDYFKLKKNLSVQAFAVYRNENIVLIVTGIGKTAMAAGVAYTMALLPSVNNPVMLNIGIAGHKHHSIGQLFLTDKITDNDTGRSYYPPLVFAPPCPTHSLQTVSLPQSVYPEQALCDMEGSAFYETAVRFSTGELIQCLKIISDNETSPANNIQPQWVSSLIASKLEVINGVVTSLTTIADSINNLNDAGFEYVVTRFRFTINEQLQLKKLLNRWQLMDAKENLDDLADTAKNGREFVKILENAMNNTEFYL
ncbi:MAG: hypothetical protein FJ190_08730 [Gammaproteobacteria bacterium]|nr:hypothetical protein [Gammaproteobacteria bacterium]